ncbi:coiled-coil-helix-coiled-coil-helix domain-containing protein 5-like [Gigantopelta aegis]|uniref:coiled-coil-helix-coiled-coil-helix domain-containing protein 5-like n=1 Tax=Gigantopelta aegis TaxID=1735272 RepID=UPI001B88D384|nr:coiled-coil-helix-coiled-coil-helix domain-containing protein 5-like [Gigantopelta aegis]
MQVELVQKECGRYFENYTTCVNTFPNTWHLDCEKQKYKLAKCAQTNPTIMKIRTECAESFSKYEFCVSQHPTQFELCTKEFAVFNKCAQKCETEQ